MKSCCGKTTREWAVHGLRVGALVAIVILIRLQQSDFLLAQPSAAEQPPLEHVRRIFPDAETLRSSAEAAGIWDVVDLEGTRLGSVLQTAPDSDPIIGFSGPSNLLVAFDLNGRIAGLDILSSRDTPEHVAQIFRDPKFLHSLNGQIWREAADRPKVDAVSGATLTSLAMIEGVQRRLGGKPASLKFTDPVRVADVRLLFPTAERLDTDAGDPSIVRIYAGAEGASALGWALRTSPAADNIVGYQGPTDALIGFDDGGRVIGVAVGKSYDNEPYVRYVRDDDAFRVLLKGQTLSQVAGFDLTEVEGVAGATMTSQAIAKGIVAAANRKQSAAQAQPPSGWRWPWSDLGTAAVILTGIAIGFTDLRGIGWLRIAFQLLVFGYLGFANGALLSQAQLVGWAQAGLPRGGWGLILLTAAAIALPIASKRNIYCSHLCPHGALQQLTLRVARPRFKVRPGLRAALAVIPAILLLVSLIVALAHWPMSLVSIEPFDAYIVRVAGGATIAIFIGGAIAACFVPMAYCRYGCPTGALLEFLRRNSRSDRVTWRDGVALACLLGAAGYVLIS